MVMKVPFCTIFKLLMWDILVSQFYSSWMKSVIQTSYIEKQNKPARPSQKPV